MEWSTRRGPGRHQMLLLEGGTPGAKEVLQYHAGWGPLNIPGDLVDPFSHLDRRGKQEEAGSEHGGPDPKRRKLAAAGGSTSGFPGVGSGGGSTYYRGSDYISQGAAARSSRGQGLGAWPRHGNGIGGGPTWLKAQQRRSLGAKRVGFQASVQNHARGQKSSRPEAAAAAGGSCSGAGIRRGVFPKRKFWMAFSDRDEQLRPIPELGEFVIEEFDVLLVKHVPLEELPTFCTRGSRVQGAVFHEVGRARHVQCRRVQMCAFEHPAAAAYRSISAHKGISAPVVFW